MVAIKYPLCTGNIKSSLVTVAVDPISVHHRSYHVLFTPQPQPQRCFDLRTRICIIPGQSKERQSKVQRIWPTGEWLVFLFWFAPDVISAHPSMPSYFYSREDCLIINLPSAPVSQSLNFYILQ